MSQILTQSDLLNADRSHWMFRDCVLWLPMQEGAGGTAYDISGRQNHGTLTNMDPSTDWVVGERGGRALDFDGSNDYVSLGSPVFGLGTNSFSFTVRAKSDGSQQSGIAVQRQNSSPFAQWGFYQANFLSHSGAGTKLWFMYRRDTISDYRVQYDLHVADGNWHTYTAAVDHDSHAVTLYVDGEEDTGATSGTFPTLGTNADGHPFAIGRPGGSTSQYYNGCIGNVMLRLGGLSAAEIRTLHRDPWQPFARRKTFGFLPGAAPPSFKPWLAARRTASIIGGGI